MGKKDTVEVKTIYTDKNSIAYERNGVRYSVIFSDGRVLITEMSKAGKVADYVLELDDAIMALKTSPEAEIAADFLRRIKRARGKQLMWQSLKILGKLFVHIVVAAVVAFVAGVLVQRFWGII